MSSRRVCEERGPEVQQNTWPGVFLLGTWETITLCISIVRSTCGDGHPCPGPLENSCTGVQGGLHQTSTLVLQSLETIQLIKAGIYL